jgi:hypothetical protein
MIICKKKGLLVIPPEMLNKISGNSRRRIEIIITDPRSRHIILTHQSDSLKIWHHATIERGLDFIPSSILNKAKMNDSINYSIIEVNGNLVIRQTNSQITNNTKTPDHFKIARKRLFKKERITNIKPQTMNFINCRQLDL